MQGPEDRTPTLGLHYETNALRNANWVHLDDLFARAFTPGSPIQLPPNASVYTFASGVVALPPVGQMRLTVTVNPPILVCNVNLPADDNIRATIVFAQVTMEVTCPAGTYIWPGFNLNRGPNTMQQRGFAYQAAATVPYGPVDHHVTMIRIAVPPDLSHTYSLWAQSGGGSGAAIVDITFGQMHAIQFT